MHLTDLFCGWSLDFLCPRVASAGTRRPRLLFSLEIHAQPMYLRSFFNRDGFGGDLAADLAAGSDLNPIAPFNIPFDFPAHDDFRSFDIRSNAALGPDGQFAAS